MNKKVMTNEDIDSAWINEQADLRVIKLFDILDTKFSDVPSVAELMKDSYEAGFYAGLAYYENRFING